MNSFNRLLIFGFVSLFLVSGYADSFKYSCVNVYWSTNGKYGPRFFLDATPSLSGSPAQLSQLKIFGQNFENLGTFVEKVSEKVFVDGQWKKVTTQITREKSENQKKRLALRIKKHNPDIIVGTEIKDIESAAAYSRDYLNDEYQAILVEGNDGRGIDICFFVRRSLQLDLEVESFKNYGMKSDGRPVFSRDFPMLLLRPAGASKSSAPLMAIFGTHLKSRLGDTDGHDNSLNKRAEQVLASIQIMQDVLTRYPNLPILMAGDFNNNVQKAAEFLPFYQQMGLIDSLDLSKNPIPKDQRFTQYFATDIDPTSPGWEMIANQLDAMFVNKQLAKFILSSFIQRDIGLDGMDTPFPKKSQNVNSRGSDHDGIVTLIDIAQLIALASQP